MKKIEVSVLNVAGDQLGTMNFLARLTQRGHNIQSMKDLLAIHTQSIIEPSISKERLSEMLVDLPHGSIKRFTPITIAVVGASRRFLMQARTHQHIDYVSASLQYSDYTDKGSFVVPYELYEKDSKNDKGPYFDGIYEANYLKCCRSSANDYKTMISEGVSNDTAGYAMPHALRNILIMQANAQEWEYFIKLRSCNRNTQEMQYVALKMWEALNNTPGGNIMFGDNCAPDCVNGRCREGSKSCGASLPKFVGYPVSNPPTEYIKRLFPLL